MMPTKRTGRIGRSAESSPSFADTTKNYTIPGLCKALGVEERTIRECRAKGLKAKLLGERRIIIRGADLDEYLKKHAPNAPAPKGRGVSDADEE